MAKARKVKIYRECVSWAARAARPDGWDGGSDHYTLELTFVFATRRRRDDDGLTGWFKAGRDGMTDARIWPDDFLVTAMPPSVTIDTQHPRLIVTVTRSEPRKEGKADQ